MIWPEGTILARAPVCRSREGTELGLLVTEKHDAVCVVRPEGECSSGDWEALAELRHLLDDLANQADRPRILVDLSETTYLGSGAINELVRCYRRVLLREGEFALCGAPPWIRQVLEATCLDLVWTMYATRESALTKMGKSGP
jgi:anti-sigma B factor antagonist